MSGSIPVTLLVGFLGSGKSTLISHILRNCEGLRVAVVVNDMERFSVESITSPGDTITPAASLQLPNGCICCSIRSALVPELTSIAKSGNGIDYIVVEASGIGEPRPIASQFHSDDPDELEHR